MTIGSALFNWNQVAFSNNGGSGGSGSSLNNNGRFLSWEGWNLPTTMKGLFKYLAHAYMTDSNVNPVIENMAAYPITEVQITSDCSEEVKEQWLEILNDDLDIRTFCIEYGLDRFLYGNAFGSLYIPFTRLYKCSGCKSVHSSSEKGLKLRFVKHNFELLCGVCEGYKIVDYMDVPKKRNFNEYNLKRWNLYDIDLKKHSISGNTTVFLNIPADIVKEIESGDLGSLAETPKEFITQVCLSLQGRGPAKLMLKKDKVFFSQRPIASMPTKDLLLWGMPAAICALRQISFKNTMIRAQAAILQEHIIPFRIFYPSKSPGDRLNTDNALWRTELLKNYAVWQQDPTHVMTAPVPTDVVQVGGQGKILTLFPEIDSVDKNTIKGLNVPREFVEGGLSYSGSSVSLRMLENILLNYMKDLNKMLNWVIETLAVMSGLQKVKAKFKPFKMADDIQAKQNDVNLYNIGLLSADTLLDSSGYNAAAEFDKRNREDKERMFEQAKSQAEAGALSQRVQNSYMNNVASVFNTAQNPIPPQQITDLYRQLEGLPPDQAAKAIEQVGQQNPLAAKYLQDRGELSPMQIAQYLSQQQALAPDQLENNVEDLKNTNPMMYQRLAPIMQQMYGNGNQITNQPKQMNQIDMRPLPTQRPPMRANSPL